MKIRVALMGGMGYPATELSTGMPAFKAKLEALGAEVLLTSWRARKEIYNFMHAAAPDDFLMFGGDSLGAGSAGQYPSDLRRPTNLAVGFQPSEYDERTNRDVRTGEYFQLISGEIEHAIDFYDPWWIDTAGLGYARWRKRVGSKTQLVGVEHRGAHPDDWSYTQGIAIAHLKTLLELK